MVDALVERTGLQPGGAQVERAHAVPRAMQVQSNAVPRAMQIRTIAQTQQLPRPIGELLPAQHGAEQGVATPGARVHEQLL